MYKNVPQTQTPTFELSNDKTAEITSKKLVDPATGQPTDEKTVTVSGEGTYTIDPSTGAVTFTPEKDFVGTAKGIQYKQLQLLEMSLVIQLQLLPMRNTHQLYFLPFQQQNLQPLKIIQGAVQTGTPTFAGATVNVMVKINKFH